MKKFAEGGSTNEEGAQPNQQADSDYQQQVPRAVG